MPCNISRLEISPTGSPALSTTGIIFRLYFMKRSIAISNVPVIGTVLTGDVIISLARRTGCIFSLITIFKRSTHSVRVIFLTIALAALGWPPPPKRVITTEQSISSALLLPTKTMRSPARTAMNKASILSISIMR